MLQRLRAAPVSTVLFAICIVVFAIASRDGSTFEIPILIKYGATRRELVWGGEYWRLFTAMFLHIGPVHLIWNVVAGFSWTAPFERVMRPGRFLFIYLLSGIAGSAVSVIGHDAVAAGASGALFGVIGGVIVLQRKALGSWAALWAHPEIRRMLVTMGLWLALGPFAGFDSYGHLGGLLAGAALTWTMIPHHWGNFGAAVAAVALTVWVSLRPIPGFHEDYFARARTLAAWEKRDWQGVVNETDTLDAKADPQLAEYRAMALVRLNRGAEALRVSIGGTPLQVAYVRAEVHYGLAMYDEALEDLRVALEKEPDHPVLLRMKVAVLLTKGEVTRADEAMQELSLIAPADKDVRVLQAKVFELTRRPEKALEILTELRTRAPGSYTRAYVDVLVTLGRTDEARKVLETEKLDESEKAQVSCYLELSAGDLDAATKACADEKNQDLAELRAALAAAKGDCDPARKLFSDHPRTRFNEAIAASCLIKEQQWAKATELVDKLLVADPLDPEVLLLKGALVRGDQGWDDVMKKLEGHEVQASHSVTWQLLSPEMKEAFPRR